MGNGYSDDDHDGRLGPGERPSDLYVAVVLDDQLCTVARSDLMADEGSTPNAHGRAARDHVGGGAFTVGSDGETDYRVVAVQEAYDGDIVAFALPPSATCRTRSSDSSPSSCRGHGRILGVLGLVTFWVLRLGVRPVKQMTAATAAAIGEGDLSQRIPESAPGTEAGELGVALNKMLGRIEGVRRGAPPEDRLRQFVADASHELHPVTTIRGYAELYRMGGLSGDDELAEAMRRTEQESIRMGDLVEDLLNLARLDQGARSRRPRSTWDGRARRGARRGRSSPIDRSPSTRPNRWSSPATTAACARWWRTSSPTRVHTPVSAPCLRAASGATHGARRGRGARRGTGHGARGGRACVRAVLPRRSGPHPPHRRLGPGLSIVDAVVRAHGATPCPRQRAGSRHTVRATFPLAPPVHDEPTDTETF